MLLEHPAVAEVGRRRQPDPIRGQTVKAFVIVGQGHTPSEALAAELLAFSPRPDGRLQVPARRSSS